MSIESILTTSSTTGSSSMSSVLICMGAALLLGIAAACVYMISTEKYTKNFIITMALLPVLVGAVIMMTSGSLGTAVAVAGAFSLVRFRSAPGTSREIFGVFLSVVIGLACGMGYLTYALIITAAVAAVFIVLAKTPFAAGRGEARLLKVTIPEDIDYTEVFDDIFEKYTSDAKLMKVKSVKLGSMFELDYEIELKDASNEKKMIDDIRVRNGNLTVVCGRRVESDTAL